MQAKEKQENNIYTIAKKISSLKDEQQRESLLATLNIEIANNFENNNSEIIEDAINSTLNDQDVITTNLLMDEIHFEIENICFEDDDGKDFDSTMWLLPILSISNSKNKVVSIPSIQKVESTISQHLLDKGIISDEKQFHLGTIRLNQEQVDSMTLQNWWDVHRDILNEDDGEHTEENIKLRNSVLNIEANNIFVFYLVPTIVGQDGNFEILEKLHDSHEDIDLWNDIGNQLSSDDISFTVIAPAPIPESMEDVKYILQTTYFESFFQENIDENLTEVAYAKLSDDSSHVVVLFFDGESNILHSFFKFEVNDDYSNFFPKITELCSNFKIDFFSFQEELSTEILNDWSQSNTPIELTNLLKTANKLDLEQTKQMCSLFNPYFAIDLENTNNNSNTLH